ncbi:rod shape-determining protein RodA [Parasphingopyxis marina]|uniref:Peptidoglycan glycosyltransferase MrdB n=1 Tax=Parasphingopyxis marina TaxID=2761622 RepID=A0A842HVQ6_9SPHN|nr:rod shape-determining protein RodA [Parasphingopyxis marina]MBC2778128.1 rod shape-determining protein RodA [Parasphingopyxis marina]
MSALYDSVVPERIAQLPWRLISLVLAIGIFGLAILYSAAGGSLTPWAATQAVRFFVFLGMAIFISHFREEHWKMLAYPVYAITLLGLLGVEIIGQVGGGSQRWLNLGFMTLQPSEIMKPVLILALAAFYDRLPAGELRGFNAIWPAALLIGMPAALVVIQPDLGTTVALAVGGIAVMFLAGLPLRLFIGGTLAVAALVPIAFTFLLEEYQRNRVLTFLSPENDPLGTGYHITQSKIAIGSGGLFGKGYLNGTQSHLAYLPEGHTDFVFATMAEEFGLLGGLLLIGAFALMIRWGIRVGQRSQSTFSKLTAAGLSVTIFFYVAINLMMVMGLAPVVGIPLPLVSYGGSAMMTVLFCIGVLMSIDRENRRRR